MSSWQWRMGPRAHRPFLFPVLWRVLYALPSSYDASRPESECGISSGNIDLRWFWELEDALLPDIAAVRSITLIMIDVINSGKLAMWWDISSLNVTKRDYLPTISEKIDSWVAAATKCVNEYLKYWWHEFYTSWLISLYSSKIMFLSVFSTVNWITSLFTAAQADRALFLVAGKFFAFKEATWSRAWYSSEYSLLCSTELETSVPFFENAISSM